MFELVHQHSRYQAQFMVLDEVFDALDKQGLRSVQTVLNTLSDQVKKLFIITHSDLIKGTNFNFQLF